MIKEGDFIIAKVVRIEQYGIYLDYNGSAIVVLGPDASPSGDIPVARIFKVGEEVRVRIGHYNQSDKIYRGFLK